MATGLREVSRHCLETSKRHAAQAEKSRGLADTFPHLDFFAKTKTHVLMVRTWGVSKSTPKQHVLTLGF